jgi:hypothetical protein
MTTSTRPLAPVLGLLLLLPSAAAAQDILCTGCFTIHDVNASWIGMSRIKECGCCEGDCTHAKEHAQNLRDSYRRYRTEYERIRQEVTALMTAGRPVPPALAAREAELGNPDGGILPELENQFADLRRLCPLEVTGNVWDGYPGPLGQAPAQGAAAAHAFRVYDGMVRGNEALDTVLQFLNTLGAGYTPPAEGFNGDRAQVTRAQKQLAEQYKLQNRPDPAPKPDPNKYREPVKPDVKRVTHRAETTGAERRAAEAANYRLGAVAYSAAYLEAAARFRAAKAADDKEAMLAQAQDARRFAWTARQLAGYAARSEAAAAAEELKAVQASLDAAAKNGVRLPDLLAKFQAGVKESGLPAAYRDALKAAGADDAELAAARQRLLDLTPEKVEATLAARKAWVAERTRAREDKDRRVLTPDALVLEGDYLAARLLHPGAQKKPKK